MFNPLDAMGGAYKRTVYRSNLCGKRLYAFGKYDEQTQFQNFFSHSVRYTFEF